MAVRRCTGGLPHRHSPAREADPGHGAKGPTHLRPRRVEGEKATKGTRKTILGVSLALIAAIGIISSFWIWIAAVMGVYWERKAGPAAVAAMENRRRLGRRCSHRAHHYRPVGIRVVDAAAQ